MPLLEICTTKYDDDIQPLKLEMNKLAAECNLDGGFKIGEPTSKFGWTFFEMFVQNDLYYGIEDKFSDLIKKCKGDKPIEKFVEFMIRYLDSRDCKVKIKLLSD